MRKINIYKGRAKNLLMTVLLFFIATLSYGAVNLDVTPDQIYFNYQDGYTCDALTISENGTPIEFEPEWDSNYLEQHKFAYIMNQNCRSIKVLLNSGSYEGLMHLIIKVSYDSGYNDGVGTICNLFIPNYDTSKSYDGIILPLTGAFPTSVGVHEFHWKWEIYAIPVNNPNYCAAWSTLPTYTSHHFYTLLAAPQAPMEKPWSSVLDKACVWASGQTTLEEISTHITDSLYNCGFKYEVVWGSYRYSYEDNFTLFHLQPLMEDLKNPTGLTVNCVDLARTIVIFSNALGSNLIVKRFLNKIGWQGNFPVNCIDLIGSTVNPTNDPFSTYLFGDDCRLGGFVMHAFAENGAGFVWDATLKYNTGNPDNVYNEHNLGCGVKTNEDFKWQLPCNVIESTYFPNLIDDFANNKDCSETNNYFGYFIDSSFSISLN